MSAVVERGRACTVDAGVRNRQRLTRRGASRRTSPAQEVSLHTNPTDGSDRRQLQGKRALDMRLLDGARRQLLLEAIEDLHVDLADPRSRKLETRRDLTAGQTVQVVHLEHLPLDRVQVLADHLD